MNATPLELLVALLATAVGFALGYAFRRRLSRRR